MDYTTPNERPAFPCHPEIVPFRDEEYSGMTLRQYAAIKLGVPDSGTDWLDEMIRAASRDRMAGLAMQAIVSSIATEDDYQRLRALAAETGLSVSGWIARDAYKQAWAMERAK